MQSSMPSQLALAMNFPVYDVCKTGCSPPYSYSVAELDAILHLQGHYTVLAMNFPMWCIHGL